MTDKLKKRASEIFAELSKDMSDEEKAQNMFMEGARYALNIISWYVENHEKDWDEDGTAPIEVWELEIYDAFEWAGFDSFLQPLEGDADEKAFQEYIDQRNSQNDEED